MANAIPSRLGQIEAAGDPKAMFLKVFSGEVLTIFEAANITMGRTMVRSISSGKSASFPVLGRAEAYYHTPGNEILGGVIKGNEKVITIDDLMVAPTFIANIDEAMNHYDVRSHYTSEIGRVLAQTWDKHVLQAGILAARTTVGNIDGESPAGTVISEAVSGDFNDPDKLAASLFVAAQRLDEKNVPEEDRVAYVDPARYYTLLQSDMAVNRDFGGEGSRAKGKIWEVAGIEIVKTNQLPNTNVTSSSLAAGTGNKYLGDFSSTAGLVMHKSAVGTVKLLDLASEMEYQTSRQGTLMVSKFAVGHGVLRPEAAVELATI